MSTQQEQQPQQSSYGQPQQPPMQPMQPPPMYQSPPQPRSKRRGPWLVIGIVVAVVILASIGISTLLSHSNNTGTVAQNSNSNNVPAQTQNQHFKIGQTVKVGDNWSVTVNSAKTSKGQDFSIPKSGAIYLLIDVSLKNITSTEQNVSSLAMFTLRDGTGQEYTETVTTFTKPPDGKVEADAPLRGTLVYEVPTTQHQFTFAFTPDLISAGQSIWDLNV